MGGFRPAALLALALAVFAVLASKADAQLCCQGYNQKGCEHPPKCDAGWYYDGSRQSNCIGRPRKAKCRGPCICTNCQPGQFVITKPKLFTDRRCRACPVGMFSTRLNALACSKYQTCTPGTIITNLASSTRDRTCKACPAGHYSSSNAFTCCPNNHPYYAGQVGLACFPAPCAQGLEVSTSNPSQCVDANECTNGLHTCHPTANCINLHATYKCTCDPGFALEAHNRTVSLTFRTSTYAAQAVCTQQPLQRTVLATSSEIAVSTNFSDNVAIGQYTQYQVSVFERDFAGITSTLLDGFPDKLPFGVNQTTYGNLPPGRPFVVKIVPFRGPNAITSDEAENFVATNCACDSTAIQAESDNGRPGDLAARQERGQFFLSWVDQSLCEQAFTFSRRDGEQRIGFTDAYAYVASEECARQHSPETVFDDIAKSALQLGQSVTYCVEATASRGPGVVPYTSSEACTNVTVLWEARLTGSVKLSDVGGSLPIEGVKLQWSIGTLYGTTTTNLDGLFTINILTDELTTEDQVLEIIPQKTSGTAPNEIEHRFLCEGDRECLRLRVPLRHLDHKINGVTIIDNTTVPLAGTVFIGNTAHPGFDDGCPFPTVEVCVRQRQAPDANLACVTTDLNGEYSIGVVMGLQVFVDFNYNNASHTFEPTRTLNGTGTFRHTKTFVDGTTEARTTDYFDVGEAAITGVDHTDTTYGLMRIDVVGGRCSRDIGNSTVRVTLPICPTFSRDVAIFKGYTWRTILPLPSLPLRFTHMETRTKGILQPQVNHYFVGAGKASIELDATLLREDLNQSALLALPDDDERVVRFEFHSPPKLRLAFQGARRSQCISPPRTVLPRDARSIATVFVIEEYWGSIPQCDDVTGTMDITNRLGEREAVARALLEAGILSEEEVIVMSRCFDTPCTLPIIQDGENATAGLRRSRVELPILVGEPQVNPEVLDKDNPFTKLFRATMAVAPYQAVPAEAKVIVTGSKIINDSGSLALPRYKPLMVLYDPPGGNSHARYENVRTAVQVRVLDHHAFSGRYSMREARLIVEGEFEVEAGSSFFSFSTEVGTAEAHLGTHVEQERMQARLNPDNNKETAATFELSFSASTSEDPFLAGGPSDMYLIPALNVVFKEVTRIGFNATSCSATSATRIEFGLGPQMDNEDVFAWLSAAEIAEGEVPTLDRLIAQETAKGQAANQDELAELTTAKTNWEAVLGRTANIKALAANGTLPAITSMTRNGLSAGLAPGSLVDEAEGFDGARVSAAEADDLKSISTIKFSGGGSSLEYHNAFVQGASGTSGTVTTSSKKIQIDFGFGGTRGGVGASYSQADSVLSEAEEGSDTTQSGGEMATTSGFVLGDDDHGDSFVVQVYRDPLYNSMVFHTVGGRSRCMHEDGTYAREQPDLQVVSAPTGPIPASGVAVVELLASNNADEEGDFELYMYETSNEGGLEILMDGLPVQTLDLGDFPGNGARTIVVEIRRGPTAYTYAPLQFAFLSACEGESYNIDDDRLAQVIVPVQVEFIPPCSSAQLVGALAEEGGFVLNADAFAAGAARPGELEVTAFNPDRTQAWANDTRLLGVYLEYRVADAVGEAWMSARDKAGATIDVMREESTFGFATALWHVAPLQDGQYAVRYRTQCRPSVGAVPPGTDGSASAAVTGAIDRVGPQQFGPTQPATGILLPGAQVSVSFDEEVRCSRPFTFRISLVVDGVARGGRSARAKWTVLCTGRTISIDLSDGLDYAQVLGKAGVLTLTGVQDPAGSPADAAITIAFQFADLNLAEASAVTEVQLATPFVGDMASSKGSSAASLRADVADLLGIDKGDVVVERFTEVQPGLVEARVEVLGSSAFENAQELQRKVVAQAGLQSGSLLATAPATQPRGGVEIVPSAEDAVAFAAVTGSCPNLVSSRRASTSSSTSSNGSLMTLLVVLVVMSTLILVALAVIIVYLRRSLNQQRTFPTLADTAPRPLQRKLRRKDSTENYTVSFQDYAAAAEAETAVDDGELEFLGRSSTYGNLGPRRVPSLPKIGGFAEHVFSGEPRAV